MRHASAPRRLPARGSLLAGLACVAAACSPAPPAGPPPPRAIVLITVDTLRADHLGCYGAPGDPTPRIDALASRGVRIVDALTPVPVTLPAHASLMTSLAPPAHGVRDNGAFALGEGIPTLAERLRAGGWETAAFVGAVVLDAAFGLDRGFDHYDDDITVPAGGGRSGVSTYPQRPAGSVIDAALDWIRRRPPDARYFAWIHLFDPHAPYAPPEPVRSRLGDTYRGEVSYVDGQIGRLLDRLGLEGRDDLLLVLTADHGEGLGEHGETTHGFFLYQSTVQVPLVLWSPGRLPAAALPGPASLLDVAPTILDLAGLPALPAGQGLSLRPAAEGARLPERAHYMETYLPYFQMRWSGSRGLREGRWKYIQATGPELYDLARDPGEERDRSEAEPAKTDRLGEALPREAARLAAGRPAGAGRPAAGGPDEAQLRSLGYLSGGAGRIEELEAEAARRPDTRARIHLVDALQEAAPAAVDRADPRALERLRELTEADPENPRLLTLYGKGLLAHGRGAEALPPLRRALELDPGDPRLHANLAAALLQLGSPEELPATVRGALALPTDDPEVRAQQAGLLLAAGDPAGAEERFRELLAENPGDARALRGLGRALAARGRWPEAAETLDRFLALEPDSLEELVLAGTAAHRAGDLEGAAGRFRRALSLDPESLGALIGLGLVLGERGRDLEAARLLERAVRVAPDDPRALTPFGLAAARIGDPETAKRALRRSLDLEPDQPTARDLLRQIEASAPSR